MSGHPGQALRRAVEASGGTLPCQVDTLLHQLAASSSAEAQRTLSEVGVGVDPLEGLSDEHVVLLRTIGGKPPVEQNDIRGDGPLPSFPEWGLRQELERANGSKRLPLQNLFERFPGVTTRAMLDQRLAAADIAVESPQDGTKSDLILRLQDRPSAEPTETEERPLSQSSDLATVVVFLLACGLVGLLLGLGAAADENTARAARDRAQKRVELTIGPEAFRAGAQRGRRAGAAAGRRRGERRGAAAGARRGQRLAAQNPIPAPTAPSTPTGSGATTPPERRPGTSPAPRSGSPAAPGTPGAQGTPPSGAPPSTQRPANP